MDMFLKMVVLDFVLEESPEFWRDGVCPVPWYLLVDESFMTSRIPGCIPFL